MGETVKRAPAYWAQMWIAGDAQDAERICRRYCMEVGLCVTVTPTTFVYTGGAESGVLVRLVNYPRFPASKEDVLSKAEALGRLLRDGLYQWSVMIETPDETVWLNTREVRENG